MSTYGAVHAILPLLEDLERKGLDLGAILARAGIGRTAFDDPSTRLPKRQFQALWQAAVEATGDPALALRVAARARPNALGVIGYLASASESRRNAFELVRGLTPLLWENVDCELEAEGDALFLRCHAGGHPAARRFTLEYAVGLAVAMSRVLGFAQAEPLEARFAYAPPEYAAEYGRILGVPVRFEAGETGVLFPRTMMESLNPTADAALRRLLERHAAEQLARIPTGAHFAQRVRACIRSMLSVDSLTADTVAARLSMSGRTLRRRLQDEGTTYQALVDQVRAELAAHYLEKERRTIDEVGFLLGFSDQSAFTKAFRRWTGKTPAELVRRRPG